MGLAPAHEPLEHDEGISMMHAAGKSADYDQAVDYKAAPVGTWVNAGTWNDYLVPDGLDLGAVVSATRRTDLHPPLYFMLMNIWQWLLGASRNAGWQLNILFSVATAIVVYLLGLRLTKSVVMAALAAVVWACLPGAVTTALTIRQYELLGLFTVMLAWRAVVITQAVRPVKAAEYAGVAVLCILGLLTHIYFVLPMSGAFVWIALGGLESREPKRIVSAGVAMAAGLAIAVLVNVDSFEIFGKTTRAGYDSSINGMVIRGKAFWLTLWRGLGVSGTSLKGIAEVWGRLGVGSDMVRVATLVVAGIALVALATATRPGWCRVRTALVRGGAGLFFFGWLTVAVGAMYIVIPSLSPALGVRYLAMTWPFVGLSVAVICSGLRRAMWVPPVLVVLWLVFALVTQARMIPQFDPATLRSARHIVIDNVARGVLLPYVDAASADTEVYAAWRDDLLADESAWIDRLEPGDLVVLADIYQPLSVKDADVLSAVETRWEVRRVTLRGLRGFAYRIERAVGGSQ